MASLGFEHKQPNFLRRMGLTLVDEAKLPRSCPNEHVDHALQGLQRVPNDQSKLMSLPQKGLKGDDSNETQRF